jgi:hypothetical protein
MASFLPTMAMSALQFGTDSARQQATKDAQKAATADQINQLNYAQQVDEQARRDRLKQAVATQRARFGAQGIASSPSANAVLDGLAGETDQAIADQSAMTSLRVSNLNDSLAQRRSLLEASSPTNQLTFSLMQKGLRTIPLIDS